MLFLLENITQYIATVASLGTVIAPISSCLMYAFINVLGYKLPALLVNDVARKLS